MGKTGHSLLKRDLKEDDAIFGGELSGHLVFNRGYLPIDDSLYAALRLLALAERRALPVSALFAGIPQTISTAEIKLPCPDAAQVRGRRGSRLRFARTHEVNDLDGARVRVPGGWFLVRASNTTPNLTARLEAGTREALLAARDVLAAALASTPKSTPRCSLGLRPSGFVGSENLRTPAVLRTGHFPRSRKVGIRS